MAVVVVDVDVDVPVILTISVVWVAAEAAVAGSVDPIILIDGLDEGLECEIVGDREVIAVVGKQRSWVSADSFTNS